MTFNDSPVLTYRELLEKTKIPDRDLKRALMALAMGKLEQRVLKRHGTSDEIGKFITFLQSNNLNFLAADDSFSVNDEFNSKLSRIRIQPYSIKGDEAATERKETRAEIIKDRKYEIEAALVRIMKSRRSLTHNELIIEATDQLKLRFQPDPTLIKRCIDSLLEHEYLKRDNENRNIYHYVA